MKILTIEDVESTCSFVDIDLEKADIVEYTNLSEILGDSDGWPKKDGITYMGIYIRFAHGKEFWLRAERPSVEGLVPSIVKFREYVKDCIETNTPLKVCYFSFFYNEDEDEDE